MGIKFFDNSQVHFKDQSFLCCFFLHSTFQLLWKDTLLSILNLLLVILLNLVNFSVLGVHFTNICIHLV